MSDEKFWVLIWSIIAGSIVSIAAICMIGGTIANAQIVSAVKAGADPIEANCALAFQQQKDICLSIAIKQR